MVFPTHLQSGGSTLIALASLASICANVSELCKGPLLLIAFSSANMTYHVHCE